MSLSSMMAGLVPALEEGFGETWTTMMRPPPIMTVTEWADEYRILAGKAASEPGPWRTSRTPYLRAIMDKLSPRDPCQIVVVQKGSQVGMTEAGNNWIGYLIDRSPGPILAVTPTDVLAKRASKQRIMPLIEFCDTLHTKVKPARARDSGNTVLLKEFPGGVLVLTGANSAVGLRSMPARYLFLDEVDAYPGAVGGEGNPLDLAERAARTFGRRRKIFVVSTPLRKMTSHVTAALNDCEQVLDYHVPCPHCGELQPLVWEQMRWRIPPGFSFDEDQQGRLRSLPGVTYECRKCQIGIEEHHKTAMLTWGKWVPRWDRGSHSVGFFINALYSPVGWFSWGEAAAMFERARRDPAKEQVFVNTILGLGYEEPSEAPDWEFLFKRRETYSLGVVPPGVRFVTAGVDHQEDRLEITLVGWGREKRSWVIDHRVIPCSTKLAERKHILDELLGTDLPCAGGGTLPIWCLAVDSGAYTLDVYAWARTHQQPVLARRADASGIAVRAPRTVMTCKGVDRWNTAILPPQKSSADERRRGLRVVGLGTSGMKRGFYLWLRQRPPTPAERDAGVEDPYGFVHFPMLDEEYFRQLTAERLVKVRTKQGYDKEQWVKTRDRNEALDCWILAYGAAIASGLDRMRESDWARIEAEIPDGLKATPTPVPVVDPPASSGRMTDPVVPPPAPPSPSPRPGPGRRRIVRSNFIGRLR